MLGLPSIKTSEDKDRIIADQAARIIVLEQKVDALLKTLYGIRSEKIGHAQLQLPFEGLEPENPQTISGKHDTEPGGRRSKPANKKTKNRNLSRLKG